MAIVLKGHILKINHQRIVTIKEIGDMCVKREYCSNGLSESWRIS